MSQSAAGWRFRTQRLCRMQAAFFHFTVAVDDISSWLLGVHHQLSDRQHQAVSKTPRDVTLRLWELVVWYLDVHYARLQDKYLWVLFRNQVGSCFPYVLAKRPLTS
jgi:hypothetical protein